MLSASAIQDPIAVEPVNAHLPVYIPNSRVCHMTQYHCCTHRKHCRLYPVCSQVQLPTVCKRDCPSCTYEGCSLAPEKRLSCPVYIQGVIQADRTDLDIEGRYLRESIQHKKRHRQRYVYYNMLFGDLAQKRRAAARNRYWQDPDKRRRYAREYYEKNLKSQKSSQPRIAEKYLPECGLRCAGCTHPDCILPENWYKKNHSHIYYREHPEYFAQYRQAHKQERSEYDRLRYAGNREAILQKQRDHRAQPHVKQQRADYDRRYRAEHREQDREKHRRYYMAHRDEINARKREKRAAQKQLCHFEEV